MKNSLTPAGIEPATFGIVAQHLNHCATAVPFLILLSWLICYEALCLVPSLGLYFVQNFIRLLTPNVNYSGRTAPLTSKVAFYIFIQQI